MSFPSEFELLRVPRILPEQEEGAKRDAPGFEILNPFSFSLAYLFG